MTDAETDRWLTVEQVAAWLQVSEEQVRRWLRRGELAGVSLGGRAGWRVAEHDLRAWLDERRRRGTGTDRR